MHKELEKKIAEAKRKIAAKEEHGAVSNSNYSGKVVVDMISGLAVGAFLGYFVDSAFGTYPLTLVILMTLGSFVGLYIFYKDYSRELDKNNDGTNT